ESPLLYYAMESWFIAMTKVQESLVNNNNKINWYPEYLQQGRFGDFIREVKDWALSRKRYWGTPLPVWTCTNKKCNHQVCVGSVDELRGLSESFPDNYDLHKPLVDELVVKCPKCQSEMKREEEVIDCWYDSGSAFFAQWHYPFENKEKFKENYPMDFICEALDQTRGWFYSLLAISTFLFNDLPYRNVLTLGLVLDKDGQKMSKSKQNYVDPTVIFDNEGADSLRWYLMSTNAPWVSTLFYEEAVKETLGKFILTLWNSYKFFATYAHLDRFDYKKNFVPVERRNILDTWVISVFQNLVDSVRKDIERFEIHRATRAVENFVIEDLSQWYIRRSRKRFQRPENKKELQAASDTLNYVLLTLTELTAPFTPFLSEQLYQGRLTFNVKQSVHLEDWPEINKKLINKKLNQKIEKIREIIRLALAKRAGAGIKVRQPLNELQIPNYKLRSEPGLLDLVREEINVKKIT
ncbi:class I tRNA ligase family protein, partial [bacterium]|nr:class I tRNA ligase family protein [bacterium]